jgi:hypothetical protein
MMATLAPEAIGIEVDVQSSFSLPIFTIGSQSGGVANREQAEALGNFLADLNDYSKFAKWSVDKTGCR